MSTPKISTFKVAATYIGVIVGAGFASGQEVLQFFSYFGFSGIGSLLIALVLFIIYGYVILYLGRRLNATSHLEIIRKAGGRKLGYLLDGMITIFLFCGLTAMAAGAGAIFLEQFALPEYLGNLLMIAAAVGTVMLGIRGVISAISTVVPVLLISVLGIAIATLFIFPLDFSSPGLSGPSRAAVSFWPLSGLIYASYNIIFSISVLAPLGAEVRDRRSLFRGAVLGGIGLGLGALAINLAILSTFDLSSRFEVPMLTITGLYSPVAVYFYSGVLLAEIYTTAVGNLYGFTARLAGYSSNYYFWTVLITGIAAFFASMLGFSTVVRFIYPVIGYAGLLLVLLLTFGIIKDTVIFKKLSGRG